jgi:hypothetical protein
VSTNWTPISHIGGTKCWTRVVDAVPPDDEVVETKIDDDSYVRNVTPLKRRGRLWFFPDDSMYVYYQPTHWRRFEAPNAQ